MVEGMLWGTRPSNSKGKEGGSLTGILKDISASLAKVKSILETSSIARHSKSPLESSLDSIKEQTVYYNEKTMKWHDAQSKKFAPKQKELDTAAIQIRKGENVEEVTEKKTGFAGFMEEMITGMKLSVHFLSKIAEGGLGKKPSAEDESEDDADKKKGAKNAKKQTSFLKGMWENMKKKHKDNWLVKHWGKLLAFVLLLNTKMSTLVTIWEDFIKPALEWSADHPLLAAIAGLTLYFTGGAFLKALGTLALKKTGEGLAWAGSKLKDAGKTFLQKRGVGMAGHMTDAQKAMTRARLESKGQLLSQKLGRAAGKTKLVAKRVASSVGDVAKKGASSVVSGVKAVGSKTMEVGKSAGAKIGSMAQSTKGIFGSIVKKFGSAGRWIMKLGSKLIMPLVTTPVGWAILAGLAIGGLAYIFWDDIKAIWEKSVAFITDTFKKISEFASSMVDGARTILGNFLRSVGAGMIADWIDPDGADPTKPKKEFTFGNLMGELGSVIKGLWKKIIGYFIDAGKAVKSIAASVARGLGLDAFADWIEKPDEPEPPKEFETTASGEKVEKTGVAKRKKWKKDIKARGAAEEAGFIETSMWTGSVEGLTAENRMAMSQGLTNGKLTRDMLVGILDSGDLSKKRGSKGAVDETASDFEFVQMLLKQFPKPPEPKAVVVKDNTSKQPGTSSDTTKSPEATKIVQTFQDSMSEVKAIRGSRQRKDKKKQVTDTLAQQILEMDKPMQEATVAQLEPKFITSLRQSDFKNSLEKTGLPEFAKKEPKEFDATEGQGPANVPSITKRMKQEKAAWLKGGHAAVRQLSWNKSMNANALQPTVSPDAKMNTFNSIQKENSTATTQSSSPVMVSTVDNSVKNAPMEQTVMMEDKIHNSDVPTGVQR